MSHVNEDKNIAICNERLGAITKYVKPTDTVLVNGTTLTQPQVVAAYQAPLDARKTVTATRAAAKGALTQREAADAQRRAVDKGLKAWVTNKFGETSPEADEFGFAAKAPAQPKVAVKAEAVTKARATRAARGIIGKKARRTIKALPAAGATGTAPGGTGGAGGAAPAK